MDLSRRVFVTACAVVALVLALVVGMHAAVKETWLYRTVWGALDDTKTLWEEMPNIRGTEPIHFLRPAAYEGQGVTVNSGGGQDDLILLSGFLEDNNKARLIRRDGTVVAEWVFSASAIYPDAGFFREPPMTDWNAITHGTIIAPDGDVVFSFESGGLVRMDRCGQVKWATHEVSHHSPNWTDDGGIVIAGGRYIDKPSREIAWPFAGPYWEDYLFVFDADGNKVTERPATEIFIENGMAPQVTSSSSFKTRVDGEFHLNEIEELSPELAPDFPMFAAGDLLYSFRNLNMLMVTDAAGRKVKWWKVGPFVRQHDPDFQKGGRITVFGNQSDETPDGSLAGGSRIWEIDPATDAVRTLYGGTEAQHVYSAERSTHQLLPNGNLMITLAQQGRAFEVTPAGEVVWEYVNRWDADRVAWLHDAEVYAPDFFTVTDWTCPSP